VVEMMDLREGVREGLPEKRVKVYVTYWPPETVGKAVVKSAVWRRIVIGRRPVSGSVSTIV